MTTFLGYVRVSTGGQAADGFSLDAHKAGPVIRTMDCRVSV
ncbi:MAG: hypothetical protein ACRELB_12805 [Polyangiaceae bacterium]